MTEYRLRITIPDLAVEDEGRWEPLLEHLEREHGEDLGPVIGWSHDVAHVVVSTPAAGEAEATRIAIDAITAALEATELADHYPSEVEVQLVEDDELAPA